MPYLKDKQSTEERAIEALQKIEKKWQENQDTENAHVEADEALLAFLHAVGYGYVADEYRRVCKAVRFWYS